MFKFNFDVGDGDEGYTPTQRDVSNHDSQETYEACSEISFVELLDSLPPVISYSPLKVPTRRQELVLSRRDLFDARFQLISQAGGDNKPEGLEFLEAPSDLVPGVYEGGLKTWECSLDLVDVLDSTYGESKLCGKRILEIGCGTAVPSLYLLRKLFLCRQHENSPETHLYLQDFNRSVLELITLPNIVLTWYMSPASAAYRDVFRKDSTEVETDPDAHTLPPADPTTPSELPVNPSMVAAFLESLTAFNIHLHLIYGPWNTFNPGSDFDIVLTSETIYRQESLSLLLDVMWNASSRSISDKSLDELAESKLSLEDSEFPACYVAGKVLYFGVGGGISDFVNAAENPHPSTRRKGTVEIVKEHIEGVGRKVVRVRWT